MSHIRPKRVVTETCWHCRRGGYTHENPYELYTQAEHDACKFGFPLKVAGLPVGYEAMWARNGSSIGRACEEAFEYVTKYNIKGVGFEFNGKTVLVTPKSDPDKVYRKWWKEMYNETPEESFAKR